MKTLDFGLYYALGISQSGNKAMAIEDNRLGDWAIRIGEDLGNFVAKIRVPASQFKSQPIGYAD